MEVLDRYRIPDSYVLLELQSRYQSADANGKIALLEDLTIRHSLPFEIEVLAVEDPNVQVRLWIARYGSNLKYTSQFRRTEAGWVHEKIEPSFYARLQADPDPLVRASLWENPHIGSLFWDTDFHSADHLSRLALLRNSELRYNRDWLKQIFDPEDNELQINKRQREDLILAFLTNADVIKLIEEEADLSDNLNAEKLYRSDIKSANAFLDDLWTCAAKWPTETLPAPVPELVYGHLPANDDTRARIYGSCPQSIFRRAILDSCSKRDIQTLKLGIQDKDDDCRSHARWKIDELKLHASVEPYPEEGSGAEKSIFKKFKQWKQRGEEILFIIAFLAFVLFVLYQIFLTEEGNRLFAKVYSHPVGMVLTWIVGGFAGLLTLTIVSTLVVQRRWLYHCFWLSLIGWSYAFSENQWMTGVFTAYYAASVFLPKIWEQLSNELVNKIAIRLSTTNNSEGKL